MHELKTFGKRVIDKFYDVLPTSELSEHKCCKSVWYLRWEEVPRTFL